MEPTKFKEATHNLGAPENMSSEECGSLPVCACTVKYEDGREFLTMVSCWQLTAVDLQTVNKTGKLFLTVYGDSHPVVALTVGNPVTGEVPEPSDVVKAEPFYDKELKEITSRFKPSVSLQEIAEFLATIELQAALNGLIDVKPEELRRFTTNREDGKYKNELAKPPTFEEELRQLINRHSVDVKTEKPDYELAKYIVKEMDLLGEIADTYRAAKKKRETGSEVVEQKPTE